MAAAAAPKAGWRGRLERLARPRRPEPLPATLDRRRVYILPTAFGWFFLLLLLAMAVGALNYNNNPALLLALLLAGAANTSLFAAHLQLSGLQVVAIDAEPVAAGKPLQLDVHVRAQPGRTRRGLRVECLDASAVLSLDKDAGTTTLEIPTRRRGRLHPGRLRISTTRPLGLARAWAWAWPERPLLVYPAPEAGGPPLPEGSGDGAQARLHPAGDDVHHLRAWRRGDSRRAIAWKPSARHGTLLVREYEQPLGADLVLDWHDVRALAWEDRIRRLARWVDEAEREGRRWRLQLPGQPALGPARGAEHRHACLRALALMPEAGGGDVGPR
ncbi:DUF58 domain-containing protein [Luteimonas lutimaris]|uniref:DUF58 domain-containing protein n=1 Tax=Luteimonas lutimaris TaxID=698645 RepID=A0ABP7MFE9_9GAMM|nr:DUF58 domain-containing protein [Luteimonas sp.]